MNVAVPSPSAPLVFLSYARKDEETVRKVYDELRSRGVNLWFDKIDVGPGKWKPQVLRAVRRSRFFIICISQAALTQTGDEPGFQDVELDEAYDIAVNQDEAHFTIVPVRLENCDRGDNRLTQFQQFDVFSHRDETLDRLAVYLGGRALKTEITDDRTESEKRIDGLQGRIVAFHYAGQDDKAKPDVETLARILADANQPVKARYAAAAAMRAAPPETVVAPLLQALRDPDMIVRNMAGQSLLSLDVRNRDAVLGPLLNTLEDEQDNLVRFYAVAAIGRIGAKARPGVDLLSKALQDKSWKVRRIAAEALASIGPSASAAVTPLIQALQDQDNNEWVRSNCVIALGQIAPQSEAVIEALRSALNDKSEKVRESADRALAKT
jgi:hypothetical protein